MMNFIQKNMALIIVAIVFIIGIYVYSSFVKKPASVSTTGSVSAQAVGSDVLDLYSSIQSVSLDPNLFSTSLYKRLVDFSTPIRIDQPGRNNPFDTIGRD